MDHRTPVDRHREYLDRAKKARYRALKSTDLQAQRSFEMLADGWQALAEQVVRMERIRPDFTP